MTGSSATRRLPATALFVAHLAVFAGLFAAGGLSAGHLLDLPLPCGRSFGCQVVAAHPSSRWFGVPVALVGLAGYLVILCLLRLGERDSRARLACVLTTGTGTLISIGLLAYSLRVIHATCGWCLVSGTAMALLFACSLILLRSEPGVPTLRPGSVLVLACLTASGVGLMAGLMERSAMLPPVADERLATVGKRDLIDPVKSRGPEDAALTIVIFGDLHCSACRAAQTTLDRLQAAHPETVRLAYRHLPLWELRGHRFSGTAAALSEIAGEKGRFWDFVERLHSHDDELDADGYLSLMQELGLPTEGLRERLENPDDSAVQRVRRDMALAEKLGIDATPTFIIATNDDPLKSATLPMLRRLLDLPKAAKSPATRNRTASKPAREEKWSGRPDSN